LHFHKLSTLLLLSVAICMPCGYVFLLNILIKLLLFFQQRFCCCCCCCCISASVCSCGVVRASATDFVVMAWQRFIYLYWWPVSRSHFAHQFVCTAKCGSNG